ncbi:hypothetical protein NFI96_008665, partial [Prochilodus magdalenae]
KEKGKIEQLQKEKDQLTSSLQGKKERIKQLQVEKGQLSSTLQERDRSIDQLQAENGQLTSNLQEREKLIQQLQAEKDKQTCDPQSPCVGDACCAEGWKYFSGSCYFFSTDEKTWTESRDACVAAGGDLVIISSTEEQTFIKKSYPGVGKERYWVGLTDAVKEGDWRWLDGTPLSEKAVHWNVNEPDNWKGERNQYSEGENCAEFSLYSLHYGLMDGFCDVQDKKEKFVCEAKAPK